VSEYLFCIENGEKNYDELLPLYAQHYSEMKDRLAGQGVAVADFNMRLDVYLPGWRSGYIVNYVIRHDGKAVGYGNVYITNDMHNGELIAQEDALFVLKAHRNGIGRKLVHFVLQDLRGRGVKRLNVTAKTDLRVAKLWERMGFKPVATAMTYTF
jgi:GNAT superfamily N-acetyltransferase